VDLDLREEKAPVGIVENLLVDSLALETVRLRRARRLEAEYITAEPLPMPIHGRTSGVPILETTNRWRFVHQAF